MKMRKRAEGLGLGRWIGRREAFASLAGMCSAADAECLRQVRTQKEYRALGLSWREFCKREIGITQPSADKIIRRLEEFGPQFFRLAQTTGITPEEYRRIAGSVSEKGLAHAGELIPITAEEGPRLIAAVEELRQQAGPEPAKDEATREDRAIEKAERMLRAAVDEARRVRAMPLDTARQQQLTTKVSAQIRRLWVVTEIELSWR